MSEAIQALTNTLASMTDTSQTQPTQEGSDQVQVAPQAPQAPVAPAPNPETPMKRRPGRPKGSGKKQTDSSAEPKLKRPVGRPRKDGLPAGSVGPKRPPGRPRKRPPGTFAASSAGQSPAAFPTYPVVPYGEQWPASVSAPPMASLPGRPPAPPMAIDPSLDSNDWASLRHRPDIFLHNLVASLSAPNPIPSSGVPVEEAFKAHLFSLQSNGKNGSPSAIPQLYSTLRTFWMPSSPAYFSLTASATTTPSEYRFFYWDPHTLVFNGIACPVCGEAVSNKGRITSGPIKVYDLGKPFFIIGCEYACLSETCRPGSPRGEGRKYSSTDASILRSLPVKLRDEFPAKLIQGPPHAPDLGSSPEVWSWRGMGVSIALWNMVRACLNVGLRKDAILAVVKGVIDGVPEDPIPSWFPPPQQYAISVERKPDVETSGQPSGSNESREEGEEEEDEVEETVSEAARDVKKPRTGDL
ncbi:unnamed protein product [Somion occarium]|uniref:Uncharacterized protein n=2 Tax=Somion occarium TaxID=3059160 RepID=A0ABP1E7Q6_9APHY